MTERAGDGTDLNEQIDPNKIEQEKIQSTNANPDKTDLEIELEIEDQEEEEHPTVDLGDNLVMFPIAEGTKAVTYEIALPDGFAEDLKTQLVIRVNKNTGRGRLRWHLNGVEHLNPRRNTRSAG